MTLPGKSFYDPYRDSLGLPQAQFSSVVAVMAAEKLGLAPPSAPEVFALTGYAVHAFGPLVRQRWLVLVPGRWSRVHPNRYRAHPRVWAEFGESRPGASQDLAAE